MRARSLLPVICAATLLPLVSGCGEDGARSGGAAPGPTAAEGTGDAASEASSPGEPAVEATSVWVTSSDAEKLFGVDIASNEVVQTVETGYYPLDIAVGHDSVWVVNAQDEILRIDPTSGSTQLLDVPGVSGIAVTDDAVWVAQEEPQQLVPLDPATNGFGDPIQLPKDSDLEDLVWDAGVVYGISGWDSSTIRVDTASGEVTVEDNRDLVTRIAVEDGTVYHASLSSIITRDAVTLAKVDTHRANRRPWVLLPDPASDSLWVGYQDGTLGTFDTAAGSYGAVKVPLAEGGFGDYPDDMVLGGGSLWVAIEGGTLARLDPATLEVQATIDLPGPGGSARMAVQ